MSDGQAGNGSQPRVGRLDAIVIDVHDLARGSHFWSGVLGVDVIREDGQYLWLERQDVGPYVILQKVPEPKTVKNRVHPDFRVQSVRAALARVEALGGRKIAEDPSDGSVVAVDPDGNEFCLVKEFLAPEPAS